MHTIIDTGIKETLELIGYQLDENVFPRVGTGGIVLPSKPEGTFNVGKGKYHGKRRENSPAVATQIGASRRPETSHRPSFTRRAWAPGQAPQIVGSDLHSQYEGGLSAVLQAYPSTEFWQQKDGFWLITESCLFPGLQKKAYFLTGVSLISGLVRGWGFWASNAHEFQWIGPRHTNFPDGSICAYEVRDKTWLTGDSLVELLDLFTIWALRHLHLEVLSRWPGPQAVIFPYERLLELNDDELCGCDGSNGKRYFACCKEKDLVRDRIADAMKFNFLTGGGMRQPPLSISKFMLDRAEIPSINNLI